MLAGMFLCIAMILGYGVILAILYYGGSLVIDNELTIG